MNLTITPENREEYLYIECKGEVTCADELIEQADLVYAEFLKYDAQKIVLYEMEMEFPSGLSAYLHLVNHYTDSFKPQIRSAKVAVVIQDKYKDIGDFWETVCVNRGFQYRAFTDFDKAEKWLLAK